MISPPSPFHVLALGSPHGDDQVAWRIAERLADDCQLAPHVHCLSSPWDLIEFVTPDCLLIVIDACRGAAVPGTVVVLAEDDLARSPEMRSSSHGAKLVEVLALARQLRPPLKELTIMAVEVADCSPGGALSPSVAAAIDPAVAIVRARLAVRVQWNLESCQESSKTGAGSKHA